MRVAVISSRSPRLGVGQCDHCCVHLIDTIAPDIDAARPVGGDQECASYAVGLHLVLHPHQARLASSAQTLLGGMGNLMRNDDVDEPSAD